MKTTIDGAGRIVIPKAIRDSLGLEGGVEIEIREVDGLVEIEPVATDFRIVMKGGVPVAVAGRPFPTVKEDEFRKTLDRIRDERHQRIIGELQD